MGTDPTPQTTSTATGTFQQALEQLVLESFSSGMPIEDTWKITIPVTAAPNWTVTIEKSYSTESSSYQPRILEE